MKTKRLLTTFALGLGAVATLALLWLPTTTSDLAQAQAGASVVVSPGSTGTANGDFENGPDGSWTVSSTHGHNVIVDLFPGSVTPHGGSWAAWLGGAGDETSCIMQTVTVPAENSTLRFWYWITSEDACGSNLGQVMIGSAIIHTFDLCQTENTGGWTKHTADLSSYAGQSVSLKFRAETGSSSSSSLFVDDVTLGPSYVYLPLVLNHWPPPPDPMTLYLQMEWADRFLSYDRNAGNTAATTISTASTDEWAITLNSDIVGTEYAYFIYANHEEEQQPPATCDVEILLRSSGNDTILASWPQAFTVDSSIKLYTGQVVGPDPNAQEGDKLVFRIRAVGGSALIWMKEIEVIPGWTMGGYGHIQVPGYGP